MDEVLGYFKYAVPLNIYSADRQHQRMRVGRTKKDSEWLPVKKHRKSGMPYIVRKRQIHTLDRVQLNEEKPANLWLFELLKEAKEADPWPS